MKITQLKVDGFGVWSGLEIGDLSDQLNVFYGPNEAGKTTLMQFVRSIFFGFSPERKARYLPPLRPGKPGGLIHAIDREKNYTIDRHADGAGDVLTLGDGETTLTDPQALATLLGGVDEAIFNNVFVFGLREIQELSALGDTQAADELYHLALGLDRVSLLDVVGELETSRNRLLANDERPSLVTQLLAQRERLQSEIEDLSQATPRYFSIARQRSQLDDEIARLQSDAARYDLEARELTLTRSISERWLRRQAIESQIAGIAGVGELPAGALERLDRLDSRIATRRRRLMALRRKRVALRRQTEQLRVNEALCRQALRLEAVAEQQHWMASLEKELLDLETDLAALQARRKQSHGAAPELPLLAEPLAPRDLAELRSTAKALRRLTQQLKAARAATADDEQLAAAQQKQLETALGNSKEKGLTQALAEAGDLVSQFRKRVQIDERLDQMSRRETELTDSAQDHLVGQVLPTWALVALGCLFVLGCALVLLFLAGLILPESLSASLGWHVGVLGVLTAGSAGMIKIGMERFAAHRLDSSHHQLQMLAAQSSQAKTERDELDARLPKGGGPLVARLQAAEKKLAHLESLLPLQTQSEAVARKAETTRAHGEQLLQQRVSLHREWRRLLAAHHLPSQLHPRQLASYAQGREHLRSLEQTLTQKNEQLTRRRAEYDTLSRKITQLVAETGVTTLSPRPLDQLQQCLTELKEQQARLQTRHGVERDLARLRRRKRRLTIEVGRLRQRRLALLRGGGTDDAAEFRRRAQVQADATRLRQEHARLAHEIAAAIAGQCSPERIAELIGQPATWQQREAQLVDLRQESAARLAVGLEKRGEIAQQLKTLLEDTQLAHKKIELSVVEQRLQDALDRWRVLAVCGIMLEAVRQYYEREHQPEALREASEYLRRLTGGRYVRVWTPLGQQTLRVDDQQGSALPIEVLSRGTREQIFLALRLALVNAYARRGVQLPLVLDDVLVNFDVGRAKAAALVLRDFARGGNQVLIFTCHEHIAKLFKHVKAEVRQLPDNSQTPSEPASESTAKRARRAPADAPSEPEPEEEIDVEPIVVSQPPPVVATAPSPRVTPPQAASPPQPQPADPPRRQAGQTHRRIDPPTERVRWSAEEFDGELSDRVRRTAEDEENELVDAGRAVDFDDDNEAA